MSTFLSSSSNLPQILLILCTVQIQIPDHSCTGSNSNHGSKPKFYSSTNTMMVLSAKEQMLIPALYKYREQLQKHYESIRSFIDDIQLDTITNSNVPSRKIGILTLIDSNGLVDAITADPFKSFQLMNRMSTWASIPGLVINVTAEDATLTSKIRELESDMFLPGQEALLNAMTSLVKLKSAYNISVPALVRGTLKGLKTNSGLTSEHCFELAQYTLRHQLFTTCVELISEGLALEQAKNNGDGTQIGCKCSPKSRLETDLEALIQITIDRHDFKLTNGTFELQKNPFHYTKKLESYNSPAFNSKIPETLTPDTTNSSNKKGLYRSYEQLCNGATFKKPNETKSLHCRLENRPKFTHPYFRLQPLKLEYHSEDPLLIQIYDVLSPSEMRKLIRAAQPNLAPSLVVGENSSMPHFSRTSTNTFLQDYEDKSPYHFISKRVEMMVGLRVSILDSSEELQIANYNQGEFYAPHYDAGDRDDEDNLEKQISFQKFRGDRIATFMIYLNSVVKGGSTAFPRLGKAVKPVQGSGVFWFNLRHDGSQDPLSLHAGCPVLYGTKWIANKWIRANEQTFIRKCPLVQPINNP